MIDYIEKISKSPNPPPPLTAVVPLEGAGIEALVPPIGKPLPEGPIGCPLVADEIVDPLEIPVCPTPVCPTP